MGALKVAVCVLLVGVALGLPQYNYDPPQVPETLYETPAESVQEPVQLYETPILAEPIIAEPQNVAPVVVAPPEEPKMEGMPYEFDFGVADEESANQFSHVESSDGAVTRGEYRVLLPDGRTQVVKFFDDGN